MILTDMVVRSNEWARQLRQRPGVHVARTVDDVLTIFADPNEEMCTPGTSGTLVA